MKSAPSPIAVAMLSLSFVGSLGAHAQTAHAMTTATAANNSEAQVLCKKAAVNSGSSHQGANHKDLATLIAMAGLAQDTVISPTAEQVSAAVSNVEFLRASGMGWGAIANSLDLRLGDEVSAGQKDKAQTMRQAGQTRERGQRSENPSAAAVATTLETSKGSGARGERRSDGRGHDPASSVNRSAGSDGASKGGLSGCSSASTGSRGRSSSGSASNGGGCREGVSGESEVVQLRSPLLIRRIQRI